MDDLTIKPFDARGKIPETWNCIDCGVNTAPKCPNREQVEFSFNVLKTPDVKIELDRNTEIYQVKDEVWQAAGVEEMGGCLCIGCLEKRIGRTLMKKDFPREHPLNWLPGTKRLMARRKKGRWS